MNFPTFKEVYDKHIEQVYWSRMQETKENIFKASDVWYLHIARTGKKVLLYLDYDDTRIMVARAPMQSMSEEEYNKALVEIGKQRKEFINLLKNS